MHRKLQAFAQRPTALASLGLLAVAACQGAGGTNPPSAAGNGTGGDGGFDAGMASADASAFDAARPDATSPDASTSTSSGDASTAPDAHPAASDGGADSTPASPTPLQTILFVGDSITHGRYAPVRKYNSGGADGAGASNLVVDENYGQTGARAESATETGPWGGIPGLFAEFAVQSQKSYEVHIEAISSTSLKSHIAAASSVIYEAKWDAVVLQEVSTRPITGSLSGTSTSNPSEFCASVQTIEKGVHAVSPLAKIYLYETWARADTAQTLSGSSSATGFAAKYASNLALLGDAYHNAYESAAAHDGLVVGVAPVGDAWARAWTEGVAEPNPFTPTTTLPSLWYGENTVNDPSITAPDRLHPSIYGSYLSGLVLFQQITGVDVRTLGGGEVAASKLGIASAVAVQLQTVAWEAVSLESSAPRNQTTDPCTLTQ